MITVGVSEHSFLALFQIEEMFGNGKPNNVLKTVKSFNIKITLIKILI